LGFGVKGGKMRKTWLLFSVFILAVMFMLIFEFHNYPLSLFDFIRIYLGEELALTFLVILVIHFLIEFPVKSNKRILEKKIFTPNKLLFIAAIFLPAKIRETSLGDMEEIYKKDVKRFGVKKAKWLMFKDIVVSNYPIMKEFARKSAIKIIKFAGVYEAVRRIIG
jgi:hypothetical protein